MPGFTNPSLQKRFDSLKSQNLYLDMTRGKPCPEQLSLSWPMLRITSTHSKSDVDCWNYGHLEGLPEARQLFGEYLGVSAKNVFVLGNSSLAIMHDLVVQGMLRALPGGTNWNTACAFGKPPIMLCPVPGYDRHHAIDERYGIDMTPIPMTDEGPDMDLVEKWAKDPFVVGMWCTPKYSNPSGITYSADVCRRLASLEARNTSFRIFWDLAYQVHDLGETTDELPNMLELCRSYGNADRVFMIGSTSKITFAGGGIAVLAASERNLNWFKEGLSVQTIGHDKLNQLRHVKFLQSMDGIRILMARHREILKPKFDAVDEVLTEEIGGRNIASWNKPRGGYFVNLKVRSGCAKRVVELAGSLGVKLTPAGAAFPGGNDPDDSHIRIAPTYPSIEEVKRAMRVVGLCIQIAAE